MNSSIELHDSAVSCLATNPHSVAVSFTPAYIHKSRGEPGIDPGSGWIQDAILWVGDGAVGGDLPDSPCPVTDGELRLGEHVYPNEIPVPLDRHDVVTLQLVLDGGCELRIAGKSARLELVGEPRYVEEFRP